jgi:hypothetical protein
MNQASTLNENGSKLRQFFLKWVLSPLAGSLFADWARALKKYGKEIPPRYWLRTAFTTTMSLLNSAMAVREEKKYHSRLKSIEVNAPIFIIGHHRSGTTHLWRLLAHDKRFIYPEVTETLFPNTLLTFKDMAHKLATWFMPEKRPQDNVKHSADVPLDEEWGLCTSTFLSTNMARHFPKYRDRFKYMLSLENASEEEKAAWKNALRSLAIKLQFHKGSANTIVFKAPDNTAKIQLILDVFPDARFIHIYRNPYRVFQSTVKMEKKSLPFCSYQSKQWDELEPFIIWRYREMYDVYFRDKNLIPANHLSEISYEELVQNRAKAIENIYLELGLDSFDLMRPNLINYINSIAGYQTNSYPELSVFKKRKIATEWQHCFEAFGYPTELETFGKTA